MTVTFVACFMGKKTITFRPVNLYIYDEKTKQPLKGVTVKVSNIIFYERVYSFFGLPIDSDVRKTYYPLENFETNEEGYVQIPEYIYKVKRKYHLDGQSIYINIETINEEWRNESDAYSSAGFYICENEHYKRPINRYKAAEIAFLTYQPREDKYRFQILESSKPYIMTIPKYHDLKEDLVDFNCDIEEVEIYLEHFVATQETP